MKTALHSYRDTVRGNSAYGGVRSVVDVFCVVAILPLFAAFLTGLFDWLGPGRGSLGLLLLGTSLLSFCLLICIRSFALVLFDIADSILVLTANFQPAPVVTPTPEPPEPVEMPPQPEPPERSPSGRPLPTDDELMKSQRPG